MRCHHTSLPCHILTMSMHLLANKSACLAHRQTMELKRQTMKLKRHLTNQETFMNTECTSTPLPYHTMHVLCDEACNSCLAMMKQPTAQLLPQ